MQKELISKGNYSKDLNNIASKVFKNQRITNNEALILYQEAELGYLGILANYIREIKNKNYTFYNRNFHIEPTNICIYNCRFCSYSRKIGQEGSWEYDLNKIKETTQTYIGKKVTEAHIVGGVHPQRDIYYYASLIKSVKEILPEIHIKAFTAVEIEFMIKKAKISNKEGLEILKEAGLDSIPGGGAEIFDEKIRKEICPDKTSSSDWLSLHKTAHQIGIPTNATMLYGHIENYEHRVDHLSRLRDLQDETNGFNVFIPLKYRNYNNDLNEIGEVSVIEDLKNYAISRIYLDNFNHIKAYWPMIGKQTTQLSLSFGVDDIDGTIDDSTKIYSMAGVEDQNPSMNSEQIVKLIQDAKRIPVERDTLYNFIKVTDY
jgi:aminodeoxyfutalosine synthase